MVLAESSAVSTPPVVTSDFCEAFGSGRREKPVVDLFFEIGEGWIGPRSWSVEVEPTIGEAG